MQEPQFEPIPGIWRFHLIYFFVTLAMGWSFFPYAVFASLLVIAGVCVVGLVLVYIRWFLATHILALAIGLGTPVVVFGGLLPLHTLILFFLLISGITMARKTLF
jgi:hypothetical protein